MKALTQTPLILGHRGAREQAPENTLPAFRLALEQGADGVELDVRVTVDDSIVVLHDATLERTTDGRGRVEQTTQEELHRLDAGSWFGPAFAGTRICTLEQALEILAPARVVNIEIKGPPGIGPRLAEGVLAAVRRQKMEGQVIVSAFSPGHLRYLRQLDPAIALAWLHGPGPLRVLRFLLARRLQLQALHPFYRVASSRYIDRAHQQGLRVIVWTVNQEATARRLAAWGVDGLITDRPAALLKWLRD
jgi:glycerophosphoryl diester phosphodiesterase